MHINAYNASSMVLHRRKVLGFLLKSNPELSDLVREFVWAVLLEVKPRHHPFDQRLRMAHGLGAVSFTTCVPTLLTPCTCFEYCWNHPFHTDSIRFHSIHFGFDFWRPHHAPSACLPRGASALRDAKALPCQDPWWYT